MSRGSLKFVRTVESHGLHTCSLNRLYYIHMYIYTNITLYHHCVLCVYTCICPMYVHMHMYMYVYRYVCVCIYIYIYIYMHIHTYTYTRTSVMICCICAA